MEVEIISEEFIKPSSPTPHHLKIHKLSLLDQFIPSIHIPMILFYTNKQSPANANEKSLLLKQSLSETLTRFYPFAGKIKDSVSIECDDEGVHYAEAKVNSHLSEFLSQPDIRLLHKFLLGELTWDQPNGGRVAKIQVTVFACGGFVVGAFVSHKIADGSALSTFLKDWAATARNCNELADCSPPRFYASALFPLPEAYPKDATWASLVSPFFKTGRCVTRRFVFDGSAVSKLKARAGSDTTRVEAVSALIWKRVMAAFREKSGIQRPTVMTHQVNIRRRAEPKYSEKCMGNFLWMAATKSMNGDDTELCGLVCQLREALKKIDSEFVKRLEGDQGFFNMRELVKEMKRELLFSVSDEGVDYVGFSSWCNFGLYEVDFGWGKPSWTTCAGLPESESMSVFVNMVILMDARLGDGIEAWVSLEVDEMAVLENDMEFLAFASNNISSSLEIGSSVSHP